MQRKNLKSEWSNPKNLGAPVNTSNNEFYPSLAKNGNLYFTSDYSTSSKLTQSFINLKSNFTTVVTNANNYSTS